MYKKIAQMKPIAEKYEAQLLSEGVLTKDLADKMKNRIKTELERAYEASKTYKPKIEDWKSEEWEEIKKSEKYGVLKDTGVKHKVT